MTPILDMINHDNSSPTRAVIVEDELFLSVDQSFSKGKEVFISYGDLSNLETLANYGFVSEKNTANEEIVDVRMIRKPVVKVTISSDGSIDSGSLAMIRSYLTTPDEVGRILADGEKSGITMSTIFSKPISASNEEEVYSFIASFLDEAIYNASSGIEKAQEYNDELVGSYLQARKDTLEKGLVRMKDRFPDLLY